MRLKSKFQMKRVLLLKRVRKESLRYFGPSKTKRSRTPGLWGVDVSFIRSGGEVRTYQGK